MKAILSKILKTSIGGGLLALLLPVAHAVPILGGSVIVASDGEVVAKFLGHTAGYTNLLYLDSPTNGIGVIFNNHASLIGSTVNLGSFTAGTELIFRINVVNTGDNFYSGPASRNADGLAHAVVDDAFSASETYVGFEDLYGGGDRDYDDLNFSFTNVKGTNNPPGVPDTGSTAVLGAMGLLALAGVRKSMRR
ncbi:MAG: hypothetical protein QG602_1247 [Verrucomicrobiota bacterium]|nr:hypothetical protein [Verrucomicrobiota bacterium]